MVKSKAAIMSFIFGILSLLMFMTFFIENSFLNVITIYSIFIAPILSIGAVLLGILALIEIKNSKLVGKSFALIGLILGLLIFLFFFTFFL